MILQFKSWNTKFEFYKEINVKEFSLCFHDPQTQYCPSTCDHNHNHNQHCRDHPSYHTHHTLCPPLCDDASDEIWSLGIGGNIGEENKDLTHRHHHHCHHHLHPYHLKHHPSYCHCRNSLRYNWEGGSTVNSVNNNFEKVSTILSNNQLIWIFCLCKW